STPDSRLQTPDSRLQTPDPRLLRYQGFVPAVRIDFPAQHHRVIFVDHVVAVQRVAAGPVSESEKQPHSPLWMQLRYVFSRVLDSEGHRLAVARQYLVLLEMNVNRVGPIPRGVRQKPVLDTIRLNMDSNLVAVHELAIDRPLPVQTVELESAD